ncbi:hypothetical protein L218DRAFT_245833 [Marasmius fiardii PR-910]|nr:hypothetical protein L218DRAFT_245833 [Marasmius fiardii PR-910]
MSDGNVCLTMCCGMCCTTLFSACGPWCNTQALGGSCNRGSCGGRGCCGRCCQGLLLFHRWSFRVSRRTKLIRPEGCIEVGLRPTRKALELVFAESVDIWKGLILVSLGLTDLYLYKSAD